MGKILDVLIERPHSGPIEARIIDGPNASEVRASIGRSPRGLARWVMARDRIYLTAADILHSDLVEIPRSLGHVYSTDGGLWWDEGRGGFRLYVNDPARESLASTEPAFWRMTHPYPVFVIRPEYRHHLDAPADGWIPLHRDTPPERTERYDARRMEAASRAWAEHGVARLEAFVAALPASPEGNLVPHIRGKALDALAAGPPTIWGDGDRLRSRRIDWRCDADGSFARMGDRLVAVSWEDLSTRHPTYREAIIDHFRVVRVAASWEDGEELDAVDRIVVEAEICGMLATDGIDSVPPAALDARRAVADAKARAEDGDPPSLGPGIR